MLKILKAGKTIIKGGRPCSPETRKKLSEARKKYLSEHPDKAPYKLCHKRILGDSYPERYFAKILSKYNIDFKKEVQVSYYSLDFLIGNIDLEIDGNQHYTDERIIESDKKRTKFLNENNFKVHRIRWSYYSRLKKEEKEIFIKDLINYLKGAGNFPDLNNKIELISKEKNKIIFYQDKVCPVCGKQLKFGLKKYCSKECFDKIQSKNIPSEEELLKKIIELKFNKVKLGKFYCVSDNAVKKWMRKYKIPTNKNDFNVWIKNRT